MKMRKNLAGIALAGAFALGCGSEPVDSQNQGRPRPLLYFLDTIVHSEGNIFESKIENGELIVNVFTKKEFTLDACSSENVEDYLFDMGDGVYAKGCSITYQYENPGTYHAKLAVGNRQYPIAQIPRGVEHMIGNGQKLTMRILAEDEKKDLPEKSGEYVSEERAAIGIKGNKP